MALSVPLSRFTSLVGGGSAFFVRHRGHALSFMSYVVDHDSPPKWVKDLNAAFGAGVGLRRLELMSLLIFTPADCVPVLLRKPLVFVKCYHS